MSKTDQFWQYAREAILAACDAQIDDDKQGLLHLSRTWTQAALLERTSYNRPDRPFEASAGVRPPLLGAVPLPALCPKSTWLPRPPKRLSREVGWIKVSR